MAQYNYNVTKFKQGLDKLYITLTDEQINQFMRYYELVIEKNKVMNLTAITDFDEFVEKHFLDSLAISSFIPLKDQTIIDLGTGAGFPGIPLKIAFPQLKVTLADSLNKRINFLKEVISDLELSDIEAIHGRAEDLARKQEYREGFDLCVSRAVANLSSLSEYCIPFVRIGGTFVAYKSGEIEKEVSDAKNAFFLLGGQMREPVYFQLSDTEISRSFIMIDKCKKTPKSYPRKAGTPTKSPL